MRLVAALIVGCGLLSLTSCTGGNQQEPQAERSADNASIEQPKTVEPSAVHSVGEIHGNIHTADAHQRYGSDGDHKTAHGSAAENHNSTANTKTIVIGDKVPDFEVTINGKQWKLSQLQNNAAFTEDGVVVLTFWCSFCHSCRHVELPLDKLAKQYKGKAAVIALDASAGETQETVAEFSEKRGLTLPIALDSSGIAADIFGVRVTTTTVVIDSKGLLRYRGRFADGKNAFAEDALKAVLADQEVPVTETKHRG